MVKEIRAAIKEGNIYFIFRLIKNKWWLLATTCF